MNKKDRRKIRTLTGLLVLVLVVVGSFVSANAASAKLSKKKATVTVGKTVKLKVKNTGSKVKWTSSNKKVATVKKSGKYGAVVTGKKAGKATITAKVGKKKLKCKVAVKKKASASISKKAQKAFEMSSAYKLYEPDTVSVGGTIDLLSWAGLSKYQRSFLNDSIRETYFKWTTSDSSVLSINKYGIGTGKKSGDVKVRMKVKCKNGTWKTSNAITVEVRDVGNVSISFQTGLNKEWLESYEGLKKIYNQYGSQVNYFNYISCIIRNDTDSDITMKRSLNTYTGGAGIVATGGRISYTSDVTGDVDFDASSQTHCFYTEDRRGILIPKHTTATVVYQNEKLLCSFGEQGKVGFSYTMNSEVITSSYFFKDNSWHYAS